MATTRNGIYYQDDYTKSADILADMKEMAESIDGVIEEEKEITEQTIQQIQETQTTQNQKIEQLDDNQIHVTTEKSNNINVKDSSNLNAKINVFGISEQETRSGKNKANSSAYNYDTISYQDLDVNLENNEFTISTDSLRIITEYIKVPIEINENGTYSFGLELKANTSGATAQALIYDSTNKKIIGSIFQNNTNTYVKKTATITIDDTVDKSNINVLLYCEGTVGNTYSYSYKNIFVNSGQDTEFEQYGASPSPDFPSEIENVEGDIDITVCNKNLFDKESYDAPSDYIVQMEGNMSSYKGKTLQLKPNTTYAVSRLINNYVAVGSWVLYILDADKQTILTVLQELSYKSDIKTTITTGETGIVYIAEIYVTDEKLQDFFSKCNIQIEENNIATDYIEHEEQIKTFPLKEGQKMYEDSYLADDGIHHKRKQVELDGTEDWVADNQAGSNTCAGWKTQVNDYVGYEGNFAPHGDILCSHFIDRNTYNNELDGISGGWGKWIYIKMKKEDLSSPDLTGFKAFLTEQKTKGTAVTIEYPLAEETIEPYTEEQQTAYNQLQNAKTYKTVTNVFTENAELEMEYIADTKTYIDNRYNALAEQILNLAGGN